MKQHKLKCWADYWDAIAEKVKPFEVRRDDRGYQKGDQLWLIRTDKEGRPLKNNGTITGEFTAPSITATISYILTGGQFGIEPGYVVLGLKNVKAEYP